MKQTSVELVLFIVLGLVFFTDFILKGLKKSSKKKDEVVKFKESLDNIKISSRFNKSLQYFIERPRNIALYVFIVFLFKICMNILFYPKEYTYSTDEIIKSAFDGTKLIKEETFVYYLKKCVSYSTDELSQFIFMWSISIVLVSFVTWQLNPYIKKR